MYVDNKPIAFWDPDPDSTNKKFIQSIDSDYFAYSAKVNSEHLEDSEHRQKASLAIILNYHHAVETLFACIGGAIQSPKYIAGWFQEYSNRDLRSIVGKISNDHSLKNFWSVDKFDWKRVADLVIFGATSDTELEEIRTHFAEFWTNLAAEYVDQGFVDEYNNIKHGLRARSGGFQMFIGVEDVPGQLAKPEAMRPVSTKASTFGGNFLSSERINNNKQNLKLNHKSRNWNPYCIANRTELVSISINNVLTFLKLQYDREKPALLLPEDYYAFRDAWNDEIELPSMKIECRFEIPQANILDDKSIDMLYQKFHYKFPTIQ
jgi:hypothetical protein